MNTKSWRTPSIILFSGSMVVLLTMGLRISFGLFLKPMSSEFGWGREIFALSMAIQNLLVGVFQPFIGAVADKWGAGRVVATGAIVYALGLYVMCCPTQQAIHGPWDHHSSRFSGSTPCGSHGSNFSNALRLEQDLSTL